MSKISFVNDKYKKARGGYSRLYEIRCRKCKHFICFYQKDGPGNLRRMYLDRMTDFNTPNHKELLCGEGHCLGVKIVHNEHGESRKAYRLFVDAIVKKITKSK